MLHGAGLAHNLDTFCAKLLTGFVNIWHAEGDVSETVADIVRMRIPIVSELDDRIGFLRSVADEDVGKPTGLIVSFPQELHAEPIAIKLQALVEIIDSDHRINNFHGASFTLNSATDLAHRLGKPADGLFPAAARRAVGNDRNLLYAGFSDPFDLHAALGDGAGNRELVYQPIRYHLGMVGVLLAAMLASSMASLSAHNHIITGIFAKDLYQGYLRKDASDRHMLTASRLTSLGVGLVMICVALLFAQGATGIFTLLFILESMFLIPLGLPLLYGFVTKGGPWWSAVCAYVAGAITSLFVNLYLNRYLGMGLNETYLIGIPAITTTIAFFIPVLFIAPEGEFARRVDSFFTKLKTPVDPATELGATGVSGRGQLALVGKVTTGMGIACFALVAASSPGRDRLIVGIYAVVTTLIGLAFIGAGRVPTESDKTRAQAIAPEPVSD